MYDPGPLRGARSAQATQGARTLGQRQPHPRDGFPQDCADSCNATTAVRKAIAIITTLELHQEHGWDVLVIQGQSESSTVYYLSNHIQVIGSSFGQLLGPHGHACINSPDAGDGIFRLWGSVPCLLMPWLLK